MASTAQETGHLHSSSEFPEKQHKNTYNQHIKQLKSINVLVIVLCDTVELFIKYMWNVKNKQTNKQTKNSYLWHLSACLKPLKHLNMLQINYSFMLLI